jgi:hypothetical protein
MGFPQEEMKAEKPKNSKQNPFTTKFTDAQGGPVTKNQCGDSTRSEAKAFVPISNHFKSSFVYFVVKILFQFFLLEL